MKKQRSWQAVYFNIFDDYVHYPEYSISREYSLLSANSSIPSVYRHHIMHNRELKTIFAAFDSFLFERYSEIDALYNDRSIIDRIISDMLRIECDTIYARSIYQAEMFNLCSFFCTSDFIIHIVQTMFNIDIDQIYNRSTARKNYTECISTMNSSSIGRFIVGEYYFSILIIRLCIKIKVSDYEKFLQRIIEYRKSISGIFYSVMMIIEFELYDFPHISSMILSHTSFLNAQSSAGQSSIQKFNL